MSFYLALVSPLDAPLYELPFTTSRPNSLPPTSTPSSSFPSWSTFTSLNGGELPPTPDKPNAPNQGIGSSSGAEKERRMCQMVVHMGLDSIEEVMDGTGNLYLRSVDRHNEWAVSAFIAGSAVKFVLLHDAKNDDGIRLFFLDIWEAYVKVLLNPFHTVNTPIRNPFFDAKLRASAKRNL